MDKTGALASRWFMDWGGGLIWFATHAPDAATLLRQANAEFKAHATLIRAPLSVRANVDVFEPQSDAIQKISMGIKSAFDPDGLFNTGRMSAGL